MRIVITGAYGFIGGNFLLMMQKEKPEYQYVIVDKLSYASNHGFNDYFSKHEYWLKDIGDIDAMYNNVIKKGDVVINFAAETHVDNSISRPLSFIENNVVAVQKLLNVCVDKKIKLFVQASTDEVYGSLNLDQLPSTEKDILYPSSPYSASKAAAEMLCMAAYKTYGLPVIITRSSNNFGPFQHTEKLIPLFISNLLQGKKVPLYGKGNNIRDWIYVEDNCRGIQTVMEKGIVGEIYNIGGENEKTNLEITCSLLRLLDKDLSWIEMVPDRLGHDFRYSLNCDKIKSLGWKQRFDFEEALQKTVEWYNNDNLPLKTE